MDAFNGLTKLIKDQACGFYGQVRTFAGPWLGQKAGEEAATKASQVAVKTVQITGPEVLAALRVSPWIQVAGLFGASAVVMGAFGAHGFYPRKDVKEEMKAVFETANKYHFIHSLALLGVPLTRRPTVVGSLIIVGMTVFCGTCYAHALTNGRDERIIYITPYGGMTLIAAWLAMVF